MQASVTMFQSTSVLVVLVGTFIVLFSVLPYSGARSIGEKQHGEILRARRQEAFRYRRTPEYDESNHFTAKEASEMREARRKERARLRDAMEVQMKLKETDHSQPNEEDINLANGLRELMEGDILLTPKQKEKLRTLSEDDNDGDIREQAVRTHFLYHWENGVVPYVLEKSLKIATINVIHDAMDEMETLTERCVTFEERSTEADYVKFISGYGCWSQVGRNGGVQDISIMNTNNKGLTCAIKGLVMHEIFHALGRFHEQNRFDRDKYIDINWNNILTGWEHNFRMRPRSVADTQRICYDYDSIMHYGPKDYAKDRTVPVITAKNGAKISGQREYLTSKDKLHIMKTYCPDRLNYE